MNKQQSSLFFYFKMETKLDAERKRFVRVSPFGNHLLMIDLDEHFPAKTTQT